MKLRDNGSTVVYDVPQAVGQKLVASGLATEVVDSKPLEYQEPPTFAAREGHVLGDYQYPPRICFGCGTCKSGGYVSNVTDKFRFRHCGRVDEIPLDVREGYNTLVRAYKARSRGKEYREPTGLVDSRVIDKQLAAVRGVKSREELIAELRLANKKG